MRPRVKFQPTLTQGLWLANGFSWLLLSGLVAIGAQRSFLGAEAPALRIDPVPAEALPPRAPANVANVPGVQARNPFDPAGTPWQATGSPAAEAAPGQLRGIVVLPGVGVAMTDGGAVRPGEALEAGRLVSVRVSGVVVETPGGQKSLALPGANRPSLQELNQAQPAPPGPAAMQGKGRP